MKPRKQSLDARTPSISIDKQVRKQQQPVLHCAFPMPPMGWPFARHRTHEYESAGRQMQRHRNAIAQSHLVHEVYGLSLER